MSAKLGQKLDASSWDVVAAGFSTACWEWNRERSSRGYGRIKIDGRSVAAHRVSWEAVNGPIPTGLHLDHLCRNHACVNPDHLEPVTNAENTRRGLAAALTVEQAAAIKGSRDSLATLARRYGVKEQTISSIRAGTSWADVEPVPRPPLVPRPAGSRCPGNQRHWFGVFGSPVGVPAPLCERCGALNPKRLSDEQIKEWERLTGQSWPLAPARAVQDDGDGFPAAFAARRKSNARYTCCDCGAFISATHAKRWFGGDDGPICEPGKGCNKHAPASEGAAHPERADGDAEGER